MNTALLTQTVSSDTIFLVAISWWTIHALRKWSGGPFLAWRFRAMLGSNRHRFLRDSLTCEYISTSNTLHSFSVLDVFIWIAKNLLVNCPCVKKMVRWTIFSVELPSYARNWPREPRSSEQKNPPTTWRDFVFRLSFRELRCTSCSLQAVLLSFLHTRISG